MENRELKLQTPILRLIGLTFTISTFALFFLSLAPGIKLNAYLLVGVGILFFIFGIILLKINLPEMSPKSESIKNTSSLKESKMLNTEQIFDNRSILIGITLLNLILFFGGAIYSTIKIDSIQNRYEKTISFFDSAKSSIDQQLSHFPTKVKEIDDNLERLEKIRSRP